MEVEKNNKRKRSENWDSSDKTLLRQLIEEKIAIIEDKNVDTNTSKKKREAWKEILSSFNECSHSKRDLEQIKTQWRKTKMYSKARVSTFRRESKKTGGGPPPKSLDPEDEILMSLIPDEFVLDSNPYDCDTMVQEIEESDNIVEEIEASPFDEDMEIRLSNEPIPEQAMKQNTCTNIKTNPNNSTKKQKKEKTNKLKPTGENRKAAIEAKEVESELIQKILMEIDNLRSDERRKEEEHQLRMRHMEEQHQLRLRLMKNDV